MKKVCKYAITAVILAILVYHSIYIEKLEDVKQQRQRESFNASQYARDFWDNRLFSVLDQAVDVKVLIELFGTNMDEAVRKYGKAPGVSSTYAYLIKGDGDILTITEDFIEVSLKEAQANPDIRISTGFYIAGNAVRDASGLIDVSEFTDTMKFNEISAEINKIIVNEVIKPFLNKKPQVGSIINFLGAIHVSRDIIEAKEFLPVKLVPIRLELE
jgi:predicted lipoprotein